MYRCNVRALNFVLVVFLVALAGCGGGSSATTATPGPMIVAQPGNQSVPMGLSGSFSVGASGTDLHYQWSRGGAPIAGATASVYTTPATAFSDTGEMFTVVVSNTSGSVTSNAASLTVTARAPKAGDLRFQQVDADSTVNGYAVAQSQYGDAVFCPVPGGGGGSEDFVNATGTGFFATNNPCAYQFAPFTLPAGSTGLTVSYGTVAMVNYQSFLNGTLITSFPSPSDAGSVVTSLSLVPSRGSAALAYIHSDTSRGFDRTEYTVAAADMQAAVTDEALRGRVVTAISYDGTNATFFSYGWSGDPSAVYEASVVFGTLDTATSLAQTLAGEGYIITAATCSQGADAGVILVGTRVQGDTMARPMLVGNGLVGAIDPLLTQGYAVVGVIDEYQANALVLSNYIGER